MSDTTRWIQPGWDGLPHMDIRSKKHQARDHPTIMGWKYWRFTKNGRNSRHNLMLKIEALREKEALDG